MNNVRRRRDGGIFSPAAQIAIRLIAASCGFAATCGFDRATFAVEPLEFVRVAPGGDSFELVESGQPFTPWGFNYDHDESGRLLEDYWHDEWPTVEADFAEMAALGANCVRIHLQFGKFMQAADRADERSLEQLTKLLALAERTGLRLDLTGLGCYHKADVPAWYDALDEAGRWQAQARFWEAIAATCADSPAVFCYDLMNEPVVPGGKRQPGEWLGPDFAGKHYVQFITLDQADRPRPDVARAWIAKLTAAIRSKDSRHLTTVGLVDWSLDRPGLTSGFVPDKTTEPLDFLCIHLYPQAGKVDEALKTLAAFRIGKPVMIEETFPLQCSWPEFQEFLDGSAEHAAGWTGFYWGKTLAEYRQGATLVDAIMGQWLDRFSRQGPPAPRGVVRQAATRAAELLAREVPAWHAEHHCHSCHNNGDAVQALATAARAEIPFDRKSLDETLAWLANPAGWEDNGPPGDFSDPKLACLQFAGALRAANESGLSQSQEALQLAAEKLVQYQRADGDWPSNATSAVGSPTAYGAALATWQACDVLRAADAQRHADAIARAEKWLLAREPINTLDAAATVMALAGREGAPFETLRQQAFDFLKSSQNEDGGWGPYAGVGSESFDTALALMALSKAPDEAATRKARARGKWRLIREQQADGGWPETTRPTGGVSYAQRTSTTAWALRGLLAP